MRTAASRAVGTHVPRDLSNRSGRQGTRSALFRQCGALGPAACTFGGRWIQHNLTNKANSSMADTNAIRCYSRLLREANIGVFRHSSCSKSGVGSAPRRGVGLKCASCGATVARLPAGWLQAVRNTDRAAGGGPAAGLAEAGRRRGANGLEGRRGALRPPLAPGTRTHPALSRKTALAAGFPRWSCGRPGWRARSPGKVLAGVPRRRTPCTPAPCWRCRP
jgi:hypothetical protein